MLRRGRVTRRSHDASLPSSRSHSQHASRRDYHEPPESHEAGWRGHGRGRMSGATVPALAASGLALSVLLTFLWQGRRVRATTPILPPAAGPTEGRTPGRAPALRVALLGESTVAGVGAATHEESLAGRTADALCRITGRSIEWRAIGLSGATARTTRRVLLEKLPGAGADAVALVLGVNDTVTLRPAPLFAR